MSQKVHEPMHGAYANDTNDTQTRAISILVDKRSLFSSDLSCHGIMIFCHHSRSCEGLTAPTTQSQSIQLPIVFWNAKEKEEKSVCGTQKKRKKRTKSTTNTASIPFSK